MAKYNVPFALILNASMICSCNSRVSQTSENVESEDIQSCISQTNVNNIVVNVDLIHPDPLQIAEPIRYSMQEKDDIIIISPHSRNYDGFMSGERYDIPLVVSDCIYECVEYLAFDVFLDNKSNNDVSIDKLYMDVESSSIDYSPYLYIATTEDVSNSLIIVDDGWGDYGELTLEYTLLKKDEEFDGTYDFKRTIERPKDSIIINLTDDLIKLGYNWDHIKAVYATDIEFPETVSCIRIDSQVDPDKIYTPFEWVVEDDFAYVGFCRIYGKISFSGFDHTVVFKGRLSLSTTGGFGAGFDYDDSFTTELKTQGVNYQITLPYISSIQANDAQRIKVIVKCDRTANHRFKLCVMDVNGDIYSSKKIDLHYIMPRHSDKSVGNL